MADKYILRITAGPDYDSSDHVEVPVNTAEPVRITSARADIELNVRVNNFDGLPRGSPSSSPYFDTEPHAYNQDQYSICFRFTPKAPMTSAGGENDNDNGNGNGNGNDDAAPTGPGATGISGLDLQFGNDFDRPIRDRLPPGFNKAMGIVRWWIDPGLDGDAYADKPYLYGPALSSFNALSIGPGTFDEAKGGIWVEEGGDDELRNSAGMPGDAKARMKWALSDDVKGRWVYEYGRTYAVDFFNPYLDFSNFALRLPGFHLPVLRYWDGQGLRYVLRNRATGEVYLAVCFSIHLRDDVGEDGTLREDAELPAEEQTEVGEQDNSDEDSAWQEARDKIGGQQTSADDVD